MAASVPAADGGRITRREEGGSLAGGIRRAAVRRYRAGVLDRMRRRTWGLSGRLIASYILVTFTVVVLVEAVVLGFQVPELVNSAQLRAQVDAAAKSYGPPREREVLDLIARGHSNRQIARDLQIGEQTVKTHVRSILTKLGLQDRVQAAIFALRHQAGNRERQP
jgi:DNA-binding CsgD family transcriptional regulator